MRRKWERVPTARGEGYRKYLTNGWWFQVISHTDGTRPRWYCTLYGPNSQRIETRSFRSELNAKRKGPKLITQTLRAAAAAVD